jgi:hypothetical protein
MPLPSATDVTVTGGAPPFDYKAFGESQAKADFARASAGSGWQFDPEKIEPVINQLQDLVDEKLRAMMTEARTLVQIRPPGDESASQKFVKAANDSGSSYQAALQGRVESAQSYVDTLKKIRDAYRRQDHVALDALRETNKDA